MDVTSDPTVTKLSGATAKRGNKIKTVTALDQPIKDIKGICANGAVVKFGIFIINKANPKTEHIN